MKRTALVLAAALAAGSTASAGVLQNPEAGRKAKAEKNYIACLETLNEGVVASSLAHIALLKADNPGSRLTGLREKVEQIAATSTSRAIRYRAYLTLMVFTSPELLAGRSLSGGDPDSVFTAIADGLQVSLLTRAE